MPPATDVARKDAPAELPAAAAARLLSVSLLRAAPKPAVEALARFAIRRTLRANEALWRAGDPAHHFVVISRGLVRVERTVPSGAPVIVSIFGPHESVGATAALQAAPYPADAIASSQTVEILRLPVAEVRAAMEREPRVAECIHAAVMTHTQALQAKIDIMSAGSVPARLATLFKHLAERFGDEQEDGSTRIPVALSRIAVAQLVSARTETVIRVLARWRHIGVLRADADGFDIPDLGQLSALCARG
jgi:CRP-like cAMP-binding protein